MPSHFMNSTVLSEPHGGKLRMNGTRARFSCA